jgi:hypothetical protein
MTYPQFYLIDFEIPVRLEQRGDSVLGFNVYDSPYPVGKIIAEGQKITKQEYDKLAKKLIERAEP